MINNKRILDSNALLTELINKQIKDIPLDKKLQYTDMKRICKFISSSIFDENQCCIWNSYVTNQNNSNKGTYINFYFRKKKAALHRLLYSNYVGTLDSDEYLKFNCDNKGKCCNIAHLKKFKYQQKDKNKPDKKSKKKKIKGIQIIDSTNKNLKDQLHISFD